MLAARLQIERGSCKKTKGQGDGGREGEMERLATPMGIALALALALAAQTSCLVLSKDAARVTCAAFGVATFVACCFCCCRWLH